AGPVGLPLDRLDHRPAQHPRALLGDMPADHLGVGLGVPGVRPAQEASCPGPGNRRMSPISATMTAASTGPMPGSCWIAAYPSCPASRAPSTVSRRVSSALSVTRSE